MLSHSRLLFSLLALLMLAVVTEPASAAKPDRTQRSPSASMTLEKSGGRLQLVSPDMTKLKAEDAQRDSRKDLPLRYGQILPTGTLDANAGAGIWKQLPDGNWSWRLRVSGAGAKSLEFTFSRFRLPHGAQLLIRSPDSKDVLGPFTDADNPTKGSFYTPMLNGEQAVLELNVPADKRDAVELAMSAVVWGYRNPFDVMRAKSGDCNVDTICPEGDAWRDQIASVAHYTFAEGTSRFMCTGSLMNTGNTSADISHPRFSTAYHCVDEETVANTAVFYWGYESPTCRSVGSSENGIPLPVTSNTRRVQTGGAKLISASRASDFSALELKTTIPADAQVRYSGWDRSGVTPPSTVGIHHPSGHEKRLSFDDDPPGTMASCIISDGTNNSHWRAGPYELGTTEGGSSGSGLWGSSNGLLIGVLSGGNASCSNANGYDCYGRLSTAWEMQGTVGQTIRAAFDRSGTNPLTMDGKGGCSAPQVSLSSSAFTQAPKAGQSFEVRGSASGGAGGYTYLWDTDGDGIVDREGPDRVQVSFPSRRSLNVSLRVRDATGCVGSVSKALDIAAPAIAVTNVGAKQQVCGNSNSRVDPGERYTVPVTFKNTGNASLPAGALSLFAAASGLAGTGIANHAGYEGATDCGYSFIDIAAGANAVEPLETYVADGNTYGPLDDARSSEIALGGPGFTLYGANWNKAVMSTNGYVSFDPDEPGGNWFVSCDAELELGSKGPQLRPYHDDMVVRDQAGAGLRYRYFNTCPRAANTGVAQGCHVFQWSHMGYYVGGGEIDGNFEFQAVAYANTGEVTYQYRVAAPDKGDMANIGLIGVGGNDPLNMACESYNQPAKAGTAICIHSPQAQALAAPGLHLETSVLSLPAIAAGASATLPLPIAIRADAACSSALNIDYVATASTSSYSTQSSRLALGSIDANCQAVTSCPLSIPKINTRDGNYSSPSRSGNGFNYHDFGGIWYTGNPDHTSTWYTVVGEFVDNQLNEPLMRVKNEVSAPIVSPPPPGVPVPSMVDPVEQRVGQMHLARIGTTQVMMAWALDDGRRGAELLRLTTDGVARANPDYTQHWYPPSEPGWGLDMESLALAEGRFDSVLMYLYDEGGKPRWLLSDGFISAGRLEMNSYRPHCPGCPHYADWDSRIAPAGNINIFWSSPEQAKVSAGILLPAPLQGRWQRYDIPFFPIAPVRP